MPTDSEVLEKLNDIFQDILDDDSISLTPETTAHDVENWDSLNHVRLMLTVSKTFNVKFSAAEIGKLKNVGDLVTLVRSKIAQ